MMRVYYLERMNRKWLQEEYKSEEIIQQSIFKDQVFSNQEQLLNSDIQPHSHPPAPLSNNILPSDILDSSHSNQDHPLDVSFQNKSFIKAKRTEVPLVKEVVVKDYKFSLMMGNVLIQLIQHKPEDLFHEFHCIVLPFSTLPHRTPPLSVVNPKRRIQADRWLTVEWCILEESRRGRLGLGETFSLNEAWFNSGEKEWASGILVRVPQWGEFDDRMLLFKSFSNILKAFDLNLKTHKKDASKKEVIKEGSIVIPWLADSEFPLKDASQLMIQSLFKTLKDLGSHQIRHIAICVTNTQQLKELKSSLRKKMMILLFESE